MRRTASAPGANEKRHDRRSRGRLGHAAANWLSQGDVHHARLPLHIRRHDPRCALCSGHWCSSRSSRQAGADMGALWRRTRHRVCRAAGADRLRQARRRHDHAAARARAGRRSRPSARACCLLLPGGPGVGITEIMGGEMRSAQHVAEFQQQYDVVTFDPRGIGKSSPIRCDPETAPTAEMPMDRTPTQAEFEAVARANAAFIEGCAEASRRAVVALVREGHRPGHRAHPPGAVAQRRHRVLRRLIRLGLRGRLSRSLSRRT